jgi:flap endonuclease-1
MGVQLGNIIPKKEIELAELAGKKIAIDAHNNLYQYLSIIRDRLTGEPLKDSKGRITSHLSGLFYRTANLIDAGIKLCFVFDGEPPTFKKKTIEKREEAKEEAKKKWEEALKRGERAITYAQAAAVLTDEMIEDAKKLLKYMGVPYVQAKSEGEAQCAFMCKNGDVDFSASQDYDSILFGSPKLVRNISITGRRKLPRKEVYIEIKPEVIELKEVLKFLGVNLEQLITIGILVGTDYNPGGIKGIGPKKALALVKENKTLKKILEKVKWEFDVNAEDILEYYKKPPIAKKYKLKWEEPNREKLIEFMVEEHDFSKERVEKVIDKLMQRFRGGVQASLTGWFNR